MLPSTLPIRSLLILLLISISSAMSLTRYSKPVPSGAIVAETREQLNQITFENQYTLLHEEDGGYMLKQTEDGTVVAVAGDALCAELDKVFADLDAREAAEKNQEHQQGGDSSTGGSGNGETRRSANDIQADDRLNACAHRRCFNSVICITYRDCHICSSRNVCI
ncbi:uncharacterized protein BO95DRAFT_438786 [Aspergillus brunneoviolaceus CBS 621.78]|uniref:Uncharacterized protein n=1 Tax=Aspergillus brunneoviolaceus CBS 621.78 TaxID=1450534 RepID=A0ACD1GLB1_9EURO|nr:hypothetical protein BO95DRAFT_438786 [Aspergillus brunneoviolaceus CBS 621.78]RAH50051.1 hypothetical protein BO95DRAFT_438786 [Aspergillus brunneoviolaceus CBS 621.78]